MATRNAQSKSSAEMQRNIVRAQPSSTDDKAPFAGGAFFDLDGSLVPLNGVHEAENYRVKPWGLEGRGGSERFGTTVVPSGLDDSGPFAWDKVGDVLVRSSGRAFLPADVGRWAGHDDGQFELIIEYLSGNRVRVYNDYVRTASVAGSVASSVFSECLHEKTGIQFIHVGTKIYYSYANVFSSWIEVARCGGQSAIERPSVMRELGGDILELLNGDPVNGGGIFKIDAAKRIYWKSNTDVPTTIITSNTPSSTKVYCRKHIYSMACFKGHSQNSERWDSDVEVVHESGTTTPDATGKDYGKVWSDRPFGDGSTTRGRLVGGVLQAPYATLESFIAIGAFSFGITFVIDGETQLRNCMGDFTNCKSWDQINEQIQLALRDHWPTATSKFDTNYFIIESNIESSTIGYTVAGTGGTDIGAAILQCHDGAGLDNSDLESTLDPPRYTRPVTIGLLVMPTDPLTGDYDTHWNRYVLHSSMDIGDDGKNPITRDQNKSELFIRNADIPVAKAFMASVAGTTMTIAAGGANGNLVKGDEGCTVRFSNGQEVLITKYLTAKTAAIDTSLTYSLRPAAIGGDANEGKACRVLGVTFSAGVITWQTGAYLAAGDVGKIMYLSTGDEVVIKSVGDPLPFPLGMNYTTAIVADTDIVVSGTVGACLDPKCRMWTDTMRDYPYASQPSLESRIMDDSCQNRFFTPLPNCDRGDVSASALWASYDGADTFWYSEAKSGARHRCGYHYEDEQREVVEDQIKEMSVLGDVLTVKCRKKTLAVSLSYLESIILQDEATAILKCQTPKPIDRAIGVRHHGGVCRIPGMDRQIVITAEPAIRMLTEQGYGENLCTDRIQKALDRMIPEYSTKYDPVNGFTFWGWLIKLI